MPRIRSKEHTSIAAPHGSKITDEHANLKMVLLCSHPDHELVPWFSVHWKTGKKEVHPQVTWDPSWKRRSQEKLDVLPDLKVNKST